MASIEKRKLKDGSYSFKVYIRKKNVEIYKNFTTEEDAKIYAFYKERLIDNMENFDIPIKNRITFREIFELKTKDFINLDKKTLNDLHVAQQRIQTFLPEKYLHEITYDEWLQIAKKMLDCDVFRGCIKDSNKRKISLPTLRRYFACASSAFSNAIAKGIELENMPLKVLQTFITPLMKNEAISS